MKLVASPYRWLWHTWYKNLKHWYWDIRTGIRNLWIFFDAVWWFRSFDYTGLLSLLQRASERMLVCQNRSCHSQHERYAKQLTIVRELCKRLKEDNYFENAGLQPRNLDRRSQIVKHSHEVAKNDAIYLGKMFKFVQYWRD